MWQGSRSVTLKEDRDVGSVSVIVPMGHALSMETFVAERVSPSSNKGLLSTCSIWWLRK